MERMSGTIQRLRSLLGDKSRVLLVSLLVLHAGLLAWIDTRNLLESRRDGSSGCWHRYMAVWPLRSLSR